MWDPSTGEQVGEPFGDQAATVHDDFSGIIRVWDTQTGEAVTEINTLFGFGDIVSDIAFSPDGKILASAGCEESTFYSSCFRAGIRLWDPISGEQIGFPLIERASAIISIVFSSDGKLLASIGCGEGKDNEICTDVEIRIWNMDSDSWKNQACEKAGRNFSQAEWIDLYPGEEYQITCPEWPAGD